MRTADVVIAGAGIAGAATAWALARRGVSRICLVDPRPPLSLTSNRPEANYRTWWPRPEMVALAARSLELIDELKSDGAAIPMDARGYLYVSETLPSAPVNGNAVLFDGGELRTRSPHLSANLRGGIFVATAGGLDTVALGRAMLERSGAQIARGRLTGIDVESGRVVGAHVDGAPRIATNTIVDAAGPYARDVALLAEVDLPIETVLRQKLVINDAAGAVPRDAPFTISLETGLHIKPDDTSGPTALKIGWAYDQTPTPPSDDPPLPPEFPQLARSGANRLVPALPADSRVVAHEGGFYARTPDGLPLIGPVARIGGVYAVAGLAGFGAMMAAAAGELLADAILDGRVNEAFRPDRAQHRPETTGEL